MRVCQLAPNGPHGLRRGMNDAPVPCRFTRRNHDLAWIWKARWIPIREVERRPLETWYVREVLRIA